MSSSTKCADGGGTPPSPLSSIGGSVEYPKGAVAVVGMACKFPGAQSVDELWQLLSDGVCMTGEVPETRFNLKNHWRSRGMSKMQGNFLDEVDSFDHHFFGKSSREAAAMDPQQRLLLETTYHALEDAGYFKPDTEPERDVGCYIGGFSTDYNDNIASNPTSAYSALGALKAFQTGRISHFFNWTGPSVTFDTACSSSAVAIDAACKDIRLGNCISAIAGGVALMTSPYLYQNLGGSSFLSPEGRARPFDADADGYARGEGVAVVFLKALDAALATGDQVLAVICASAVRQNSNRFPITGPDPYAQADLYRRLARIAQIDPVQVTYVEAHAAGTRIGDIPEFTGIKEVFDTAERRQTLYISSIKANIGHAEGASGVAGLIKTILMMKHRRIPPQAQLGRLHGDLQLIGGSIIIPRKVEEWEAELRIACINNFGAAGSIAAMIVAEPPGEGIGGRISNHRQEMLDIHPICVSAHSVATLRRNCSNIMQKITHPGAHLDLPDVAFTLSRRINPSLEYRWTTMVRSLPELADRLRETLQLPEQMLAAQKVAKRSVRPVVLVFGGQTSATVHIDRQNYDSCLVFRRHLDHCNEIVQSLGVEGLYPMIFENRPCHDDIPRLHAMIFAAQYACARTWIDSGLRVSRVLGHSIGQLVALSVSGMLSVHDALRLILSRARLIQDSWGEEKGAMMAIHASQEEIRRLMQEVQAEDAVKRMEIACYNGPKSHVVAGKQDAIRSLESVIEARHIQHKQLSITHGFHCWLTESIMDGLAEIADSLTFSPPSISLETCSADKCWDHVTPRQIQEHTRQPVYFYQAVRRVVDQLGPCTWLEAGSSSSIAGMVAAALDTSERNKHSIHAGHLNKNRQTDGLAVVTVSLWKEGHSVQYWPFHSQQSDDYSRVALPPYAFEKNRHWLPLREISPILGDTPSPSDLEDKQPVLGLLSKKTVGAGIVSFEINPRSVEWTVLVDGHAVLNKALCPASAYVEIVRRAAQQLFADDNRSSLPMSCVVEDLEIHQRLGRDNQESDSNIALTMRPKHRGRYVWGFSIRTGAGETASGVVRLAHSEDDLAMGFQRLGQIVTLSHWQNTAAWDAGNILQGQVIYQLLSAIVHYSSIYQVLQRIQSTPSAVMADVAMSPEECHGISYSIALEGFLQLPAMHANFWGPHAASADSIFMCTGMKHIQSSSNFSSEVLPGARWTVIARLGSSDAAVAEYDILVYNPTTSCLVQAIYGARFAKASKASLKRVLYREKGFTSADGTLSSSRQALLDDHSKIEVAKDAPQEHQSTVTIERQLRGILAGVMDYPLENLSATTPLRELGVDSLMLTEIQHAIQEQLGVEISSTELLNGRFGVLAETISTRTRNHTARKTSSTPLETSRPRAITEDIEDTGLRLTRVFEEHLGPLAPIESRATLAHLGVDSLLRQELASDIERAFAVSLGHGELTPDTTFGALCSRLRQDATVINGTVRVSSVQEIFQTTQKTFGKFALAAGWLNFWQKTYSLQSRLVVSYVLEAFSHMGADIQSMARGEPIPVLSVIPQHQQLRGALYEILSDAGCIDNTGEGCYIRSDQLLRTSPSSLLHEELIRQYPAFQREHELLRVTGPHLAAFLRGEEDPLRHLFGVPKNRRLLESFYSDAPMFKTMTLMLREFIQGACKSFLSMQNKPIQILELGAGTGGTTQGIIDALSRAGIPFIYTFSDLSNSLVIAARRRFAAYASSMEFAVVDIEKEPDEDFLNRFHIILSTNCIHGTRSLQRSLTHVRQMLQPGGLVCLVEITRRMFWLDLVFGLLEGWWLFDDGRQHALASPSLWESVMLNTGFEQVLMTDGSSAESRTVRMIAGFTTKDESVAWNPRPVDIAYETLVFKQEPEHLRADIYYPCVSKTQAGKSWAIALLIHGGGHVMLSRKHIRPAQTQLLLDNGVIPVSIDYRLCPEVSITQGPLRDVRDAFLWVRKKLPHLALKYPIALDGDRVAVVGWSSGGTLALSCGYGYTSLPESIRPPEAILTFYSPTDYEDDFWKKAHGPKDRHADDYRPIHVLETAVGNGSLQDIEEFEASAARARWDIYLRMTESGQTVPLLAKGVSGSFAAGFPLQEWPSVEEIREFSPYAHIVEGEYRTPTYLVHGKHDELVPWQQAVKVYEALTARGILADVALPETEMHLFDIHADKDSERWQEVAKAYQFVFGILR